MTDVDRLDVIARKYDCPRCWGTGSLESSDSTEDGWWDCSTCKGTGKLADRRRPDPQLVGAVDLIRRLLPGWGSDEHGCDLANYAAYEEAVALIAKEGQ
jgi:hypothetical protein